MFSRFSNFLVVLIFFATISQTLCQTGRPKPGANPANPAKPGKTAATAAPGQTCGKSTPVCIKGPITAAISSANHAPTSPAGGGGAKCGNGGALNCCDSGILKVIGNNKASQKKTYQSFGCKPGTGTTAAPKAGTGTTAAPVTKAAKKS